jgi:hypothetical protein
MMFRPLVGPILIAVIATTSIAACTSSTPTAGSSPTAPPAATAPASPPATVAPSPSASASPSPQIFSTPTSAAQHLYAAWKANDRTDAAIGASPAAVHALFTRHWTSGTYFFGGCSTHTECDYNFSTGAIRMTLTGTATTGYKVTAIAIGNAG